jgi:tRNA-uridine 2-sulfurtransferase
MNTKEKTHKVVVGLSGGVDSALTAALLLKEGREVSAVFMQNWDANDPHCNASEDLSDARAVADQLGIPLTTVNFSKEYWDNVFSLCLDEFAAGRTPNPDVLCNREIKFKPLLKTVGELGGTHLATGHYAQIKHGEHGYELHKGIDENKDQSYFLYLLNQQQLSQALFPLGGMHKPDVRVLADKMGLVNAKKKDSTGICFVGERRFKPFLQEFLTTRPGPMKTEDGNVVGQHDGVMFYTLGQRQGLNIGGTRGSNGGAWYVIDKNVKDNILVVAQDSDHPRLLRSNCHLINTHWISGMAPTEALSCCAKMRYRQPDQACVIIPGAKQTADIEFPTPQRALTPGQSIVFYQGTLCLGGGIIDNLSP